RPDGGIDHCGTSEHAGGHIPLGWGGTQFVRIVLRRTAPLGYSGEDRWTMLAAAINSSACECQQSDLPARMLAKAPAKSRFVRFALALTTPQHRSSAGSRGRWAALASLPNSGIS